MRKSKMTKKRLILSGLALLVLTLTLLLSGCGREEIDLEGKSIVVFVLNDGTLDYKTSSTNDKINYAYDPGTYILDPSQIPGYQFYRSGYVFTGWYTSAECKAEEKWNFDEDLVGTEDITLYAGWAKNKVYTYALYYSEGEELVKLGEYQVDEGDKFNDRKNLAKNREGYTPLAYYSDSALTQPWDSATVHPGGEEDTEIAVYVDYIEGDWSVVTTLSGLKNAIDSDLNVYLMADIDCGGAEVSFGKYAGTLAGNQFTVSNFVVNKSGVAQISCSIFSELEEGSKIMDVSFKDVTYKLLGASNTQREIKIAALAKTVNGATVENVSIEGTLLTDSETEFPTLNSAFYEEKGNPTVITDFSAVIDVEKQAK